MRKATTKRAGGCGVYVYVCVWGWGVVGGWKEHTRTAKTNNSFLRYENSTSHTQNHPDPEGSNARK